MKKIYFSNETNLINNITDSIQSKLDGVENEEQLSLDDIKKLRESATNLLNTIEDEISNWE